LVQELGPTKHQPPIFGLRGAGPRPIASRSWELGASGFFVGVKIRSKFPEKAGLEKFYRVKYLTFYKISSIIIIEKKRKDD